MLETRTPGDLFRMLRERRQNATYDPDEAWRRERSAIAAPGCRAGELRMTWVGQATFLIQCGAINVLTDPVWSHRASPFTGMGPARLSAPGVTIAALPPVHAILISHDHYDHLDDATVRTLHRHFGPGVRWITPLGYTDWLRRRGITDPIELDWWHDTRVDTSEGSVQVSAVPVQHWTRRAPFARSRRLWSGYVIDGGSSGRVFFAGDTGYFHGFGWTARDLGPFHATLLPIGAYEPRWFMRPMHMDPDEAVQAYLDLGGRGVFGGMHWGTFRLTDEPPREPPERTRAAWRRAGLDDESLWLPVPGETRIVA